MGKSEVHYGSHKKEEKVRPECSICILYVLNSLFPDVLARNLKSLYKKSHVKNRAGLPSSTKGQDIRC